MARLRHRRSPRATALSEEERLLLRLGITRSYSVALLWVGLSYYVFAKVPGLAGLALGMLGLILAIVFGFGPRRV